MKVEQLIYIGIPDLYIEENEKEKYHVLGVMAERSYVKGFSSLKEGDMETCQKTLHRPELVRGRKMFRRDVVPA